MGEHLVHSVSKARQRDAFTLLELMVSVTIVAVLSAIAIPTFSSYVYQARTSEATTFLGDIRARQEAYRSEFGEYCDVSAGATNYWPSAAYLGHPAPVAWADSAAWNQLGARPSGAVRFRYSTTAGVPGAGNGPSSKGFGSDLGYTGNDFWFVSRAVADLDGDGTPVLFEAYSAAAHVYIDTSKGWE